MHSCEACFNSAFKGARAFPVVAQHEVIFPGILTTPEVGAVGTTWGEF